MPGGGGMPGGGMPQITATVRWESAAPVRAASKEALSSPPDAYRISMSGLPAMPTGGEGRGGRSADGGRQAPDEKEGMERLRQSAMLECKGQSPLRARSAERLGQSLVFDFDRAEFPLTANSKEITFSLRMGPLVVKAKFNPKEMVFKDQIAL